MGRLPYRGQALPAVFTLPPGYQKGTRIPVVVAVPGMDGYKERFVGLRGDPWTERGVAVLCVEGPGYWEAPLRGLFIDVPGWAETGKEAMKWLLARPEIDPERIGVVGSSFGSFFSAILMSDEPRYKAGSVIGTCYEPGGYTIFEEASPTFKRRFMFMSGITDEAEFDKFRKSLDWKDYAGKIKVPFQVFAGEADELCPVALHRRLRQSAGWAQAARDLPGLAPQHRRRAVGVERAGAAHPSAGMDDGAARGKTDAERALVRGGERPDRKTPLA